MRGRFVPDALRCELFCAPILCADVLCADVLCRCCALMFCAGDSGRWRWPVTQASGCSSEGANGVMTHSPILIPHAPGVNRDREAAAAVAAAGGDPRIVPINALISGEAAFSDHGAVLLPGGFSYGDCLGAGGRLALELRAWFGAELEEAVRAGRPILGICNGFQALVKSGLLERAPAIQQPVAQSRCSCDGWAA